MRNAVVCMLVLVLAAVGSEAWAQGRPNLTVEIRVERETYKESAHPAYSEFPYEGGQDV